MALRIPPNQTVQTLAIQNTRDGQEEKKSGGAVGYSNDNMLGVAPQSGTTWNVRIGSKQSLLGFYRSTD